MKLNNLKREKISSASRDRVDEETDFGFLVAILDI